MSVKPQNGEDYKPGGVANKTSTATKYGISFSKGLSLVRAKQQSAQRTAYVFSQTQVYTQTSDECFFCRSRRLATARRQCPLYVEKCWYFQSARAVLRDAKNASLLLPAAGTTMHLAGVSTWPSIQAIEKKRFPGTVAHRVATPEYPLAIDGRARMPASSFWTPD